MPAEFLVIRAGGLLELEQATLGDGIVDQSAQVLLHAGVEEIPETTALVFPGRLTGVALGR